MTNEFFMREAIKLAQKAFEEDEVPVGAVVVYKNQIIGRGHNQTEHLQDPTAHAEIIAITAAANAQRPVREEQVVAVPGDFDRSANHCRGGCVPRGPRGPSRCARSPPSA